jgi:hypothetical protein
LDPFSGYRLASGHSFFHVALFVCSYFVTVSDASDMQSSSDIRSCF